MFILRSWANQQVVTTASINACRGHVIEDAASRGAGSTAVSTINEWARKASGNPKAGCFEWNRIKGEWTIGTFQKFFLRMAFGSSRSPKGPSGIA